MQNLKKQSNKEIENGNNIEQDSIEKLRELGKKFHPDFYKNYDFAKDRKNYLESLTITKKSKQELTILKDTIKNYSILEEILMTGKTDRLKELTFFHDNKALEILLTFYKGDFLDLSGLLVINSLQAQQLKNFKGKKIDLSGLIDIDRKTYLTLTQFPGELVGIDYLKPSK